MSGANAFTKLRLTWIEASICDPILRPAAKVVATNLGLRWVNRATFDATGMLEAWPSVPRLMQECCLSEEGVLGALRQLRGKLAPREAKAGLPTALPYLELLEIHEFGAGQRTRTNRYRLIPRAAPARLASPQKTRVVLGARVGAEDLILELGTPNDLGESAPNKLGESTPKTLGRHPLTDPLDQNPSHDRRAN